MRRNIISVILVLSLFTISLTSIADIQVLYSSNQNIEIKPFSIMFYKGSIYIAFDVCNTTDNSTTFTTFYVLKITNGSSKILLELESKPNHIYMGALLTYDGKLYIKITQYKIITGFLTYVFNTTNLIPEFTYVYVYNGSYLEKLSSYQEILLPGVVSLSVLSYGNHSALLNTTYTSLSITFNNGKTVTLKRVATPSLILQTVIPLVTQNGVIITMYPYGSEKLEANYTSLLTNYAFYYYSWDGKLISKFTLTLIAPFCILSSPNVTYNGFSRMLAVGSTLYIINGSSKSLKLLVVNLLNGNVDRTLNINGLPLGLMIFDNKPTLVVQKVNELLLYSIGERLSKIITIPLIFKIEQVTGKIYVPKNGKLTYEYYTYNVRVLENRIFYNGNYFISEVNISSSLFNVTVYTTNDSYNYTTTYNFTSIMSISRISNTLFGVKDNNTYLIVLSNNGSILTTIQLPNVTKDNGLSSLIYLLHDNMLYIAYALHNVTQNITSLYLETYKLPTNSTHLLISYSFNPLIFGIIGIVIIVIAVAIIKFLIKRK